MSEDGDAELAPVETLTSYEAIPITLDDDGGGENGEDGASTSTNIVTDVNDGVINNVTPMEISNVNDIQAGTSNFAVIQQEQQQQPQQPVTNGAAPPVINGVDTNQLVMVLQFLRSTGCKEAEGALAKELNLTITTTDDPMDSNGNPVILPPPFDL
uniref:LisH domain-containing protein n=1 Tax=Panagrolaimus sp. ES5 TaxID=591445 RepID=A0AC34GDI3_9BILA